MAEDKYIINRGNYTYKRRHKSYSGGTIYERDYAAVTNLGGFDGNVFPNEEHGFKFVPVDNKSVTKKHRYGGIIGSLNGKDLENIATSSTESYIKLKTGHSSFLDFVYYGSCVEFLNVEINDIIRKFPAELYFKEKAIEHSGNTYYVLDNPFEIDIWNNVTPTEQEYFNPLRYFSESRQNYTMYNSEGQNLGCLDSFYSWTSAKNSNFRFCDWEFSHEIQLNFTWDDDFENEILSGTQSTRIYRMYLNGEFVLLYENEDFRNWRITPAQNYAEAAFDDMDEFETILLNRGTKPLYTATLDFMHETERGFETYKKRFTWPTIPYVNTSAETIHRYNLDITSEDYQAYVTELIKLCQFYDEYFTDNLWRNMCHDAIKNMDNTVITENSLEDKNDIKENAEKMHSLLNVCGRFFDDIILYINGIKNINSITYNDDGNVPDYFLTDVLNLSGWEVSNSMEPFLKNTDIVKNLWKGIANEEYDVKNANVQFLKNLELNSHEILSRKGTRYSLEMVLGLFGMIQGEDYIIDEHVRIAKQKEGVQYECQAFDASGNTILLSAETWNNLVASRSEDSAEGGKAYDSTEGLPIKIKTTKINGDIYKYFVPWFKMGERLDGGMYFQMYGGWDKEEDEYKETLSYLGVVEKKVDLDYIPENTLKGGDIYFVTESGEYMKHTDDEKNPWRVMSTAITSADKNEIDTLESIIEENKGNNPHVGYGNYDSGDTYFEYFKQIFKGAKDADDFVEDAYKCDEEGLQNGIEECGFDISDETVDNKKCWYYGNGDTESNYRIYDNAEHEACNNMTISDYEVYDFLSGGTSNELTENSADSVINSKFVKINFIIPNFDNASLKDDFKNYIETAVMPYLRQVIPSTTIFEIGFEEINE
jgi:hypothetical protein